MTEQIIKGLIAFFILAGASISLLSTIGLIRFPDVYLRSHAATKSATLGMLLLIIGAMIYFGVFMEHFSFRLLLTMVFVLITAPVAGHLIGRAAYKTGVPLWKGQGQDKEVQKVKKKTHTI